MDCLVAVLASRPLTLHASLRQPPDATDPQRVPRALGPLGAFFTVAVVAGSGERVYESMPAKAKLKLDPDDPASYLPLDPGNTFGTVLTVDAAELELAAGDYRLSVTYENGAFSGPAGDPIGHFGAHAEVPLHVG